MILEIDNFEQFKVFFDVVYDITEFIELQMFKSHMICSILDKARTRFMSVEFREDFFALYEVDDAESVTLFAEDLHKIIKSANRIDTVTLETNDNYLICKIESKNGNSRIFEFVLPNEVIESPQPPSLSLPVNFNLDLKDLKQGIKDLKVIGSDEIKFTVSNSLVSITAGIETTTNYVYNLKTDVAVDYSLSAKFTLDYLEQLLKFDKINNVLKVSLGDDFPFLYSIEDEIMGVKINGLIAPRIEVD